MSEFEDPSGSNPFSFMLGDIIRALGSNQVDPTEIRRQFAQLALGGSGSDGIELHAREQVEMLAELAARHLASAPIVGPLVPAVPTKVSMLRPSEWIDVTFRALGPYLDLLADAFSGSVKGVTEQSIATLSDAAPNDMLAFAAQLSSSIGPMLSNAQIGSLIGHWALSAWSGYDLVIPRPSDGVVLVPAALVRAASTLLIPEDELVLYWCARELAVSLIVALPLVADRLDTELRLYLLDVRADTSRMLESFTEGTMSDPGFLERFGSDPGMFLSADPSPAQQANLRELEVTLALIEVAVMLALGSSFGPLAGSGRWLDSMYVAREEDPARSTVASVFGMDLAQTRARAGRLVSELELLGAELDSIAGWVGRALMEPDAAPSPEEFGDPGRWITRLAQDDA
ncbi:MAG: zinc-dependent metalloprotease [Ferrimicrobium sp.]